MDSKYSPSKIFRHCPKCGKPGFAPENEKSLKCNSCGFRYFINMSASVAAIIRNDRNEFLFTVRKHNPAAGKLDLPGGFVDLGETAESAIVREVNEELNLNIIKLEFIGTFTNKYIYEEIEYQTLDLAFNCHVNSMENIKPADDVSGFVFKNPALVKQEEIGLNSIWNIVQCII
jgi:NAD+ diphosphatase